MRHALWIASAAIASMAAPASAIVDAGSSKPCPCGVTAAHSHSGGDGIAADPFRIQSKWTSTVTNGSVPNRGTPITLRWSIVPDGTPIPGGVVAGEGNSGSSARAFFDGLYGSGLGGSDLTQRPWFSIFQSSFARWEQLAGLTYVYEPNDDGQSMYTNNNGSLFAGPAGQVGVRGDVRIGGHPIDGASNVLAYNFYPNSGEMILDTNDGSLFGSTVNSSRAARNIIMHEHGHGVGLNHLESNNSNQLMEPFLDTSFDGPQFDDILGVQRMYGDALEKGGRNNTAATATSLGFIAAGGTASRGIHANTTAVAPSHFDFISIDGSTDVDYFSFSVAQFSSVTLTLTPKGPTYNEGPQGGAQSAFVTSALNDLTLELFDTNGVSSLAFTNSTGAGSAEIISDFALPGAGTYYAKVAGLFDQIQMYRLDVAVQLIPEPSGLAVLALAAVGLLRRRRAL
jgi:serralysin